MSEWSGWEKSTERFTELAVNYSRWRPSYPAEALDYITVHCNLSPSCVVADVGCGTGISSRLIAQRGFEVIGIEPNKAMREEALRACFADGGGRLQLTYQEDTAESTKLPDGKCHAVIAAQSFHWFDADLALKEFHRILKDDGWVVLMWNELNDSDPFTSAYRQILEIKTMTEAASALIQCPLFQEQDNVCFLNSQTLDEAGLLGRAFSVSYAPRTGPEAERVAADLKNLFQRFEKNGFVILRYKTSVYTGRRKNVG